MLKTILNKLYNLFLDIYSPKFCLFCLNWQKSYFCDSCLEKVGFNMRFNCFICGKRISFGERCQNHSSLIKGLISFGIYEESKLKEKIIFAKNEGYSEVFFDLGKKIGEKIKDLDFKGYFLTYVPLHRKKYFQRGFNQAEVLALGIKNVLGLEIFPYIEKVRETKDQSELSLEERKDNLKDAFRVTKKPPEKLILVDDIKTSGTTLKEVSKELKKSGAKEIIALTILR
ncbi:MAG: ComF family protein [Minisyncoccia bacterium]